MFCANKGEHSSALPITPNVIKLPTPWSNPLEANVLLIAKASMQIGRSEGVRVCTNIPKEVTLKRYVKRQSQQIKLCSVSVCGGAWLGTTVFTEPPAPEKKKKSQAPVQDSSLRLTPLPQ